MFHGSPWRKHQDAWVCVPSLSCDDANSKSLPVVRAACWLPGVLPEDWLTHLLPERKWLLLGPLLVGILRVCNLTYSWSPVSRCQVGQCRCRLARGLSKMVIWHLPLLSGSDWPQTAASLLWTRWAWRGNPVTIMQGLLVLFLLLCAGCEGVLWARMTCPSGPPEIEKGICEAPCGSVSENMLCVCVCVGVGIKENCPDEALGWWEEFHLRKITPGMSRGFRRTTAVQNFVVQGSRDQGCIHLSISV